MNVDIVGAVRMSRGKLFHAVGPATDNARLSSWRLVRGTRRSPRAAERRAERVATVETGTHSSFIYDGAGESNPLSHSQPVEIVTKQRSYMVSRCRSIRTVIVFHGVDDHVTNEKVIRRATLQSLSVIVRIRRLKLDLAGHYTY